MATVRRHSIVASVGSGAREWTLPEVPSSGTIEVWRNGLMMMSPGDYAVSGNIIAFTVAQGSDPADVITCSYDVTVTEAASVEFTRRYSVLASAGPGNRQWLLPEVPQAGTIEVRRNGLVMAPSIDYIVAGNTVTFTEEQGSETTDVVSCSYDVYVSTAIAETSLFNLDLAEIAEEAYERCGLEMRSGYDLKTARRSLNLLTIEWANRGPNLWTIEERTLSLSAGVGTYALPVDTIDVVDHVFRTAQGSDYPLTRTSRSDYAALPNKTTSGQPNKIYISRSITPMVALWPVPSVAATLVYWRMRRIKDAGSGGAFNQDVPFRFLPALTAGLAYYLSVKKAPALAAGLKADYEEQLRFATDEDRDRTSMFIAPGIG
jgi:hypothetical protein